MSAAGRLAGLAGLQALSGAACWVVALAVLDDHTLGIYGSSLAVVQLAALIGGAGLPVVVYRFASDETSSAVGRFALIGVMTGGAVVCSGALVSGAVPVSWGPALLLAGLGPAACAAVVGDALLVARSRWDQVALRVAMVMVLRLGLLGGAASGGSIWAAVVAAVAPDAVTVIVMVHRSGPSLIGWPRGVPSDFVSFVLTQYVSAVLSFGPVLVVPVLAARVMSEGDRAVFLPAWAVLAMAFSAVHAAANGRLLAMAAATETWARKVSASAAVGTVAIVSTGAALGGVATIVDASGGYGRLVAVAGTAAVLLVGSGAWPVVAGWLSEARRLSRNWTALALVAPLGVVTVLLGWGEVASDPRLVALMWAVGMTGSALVGLGLRPWSRA